MKQKLNPRAYLWTFLLIISSLLLMGCTSTYTALQEIEPGRTKQEVRIELGKPTFVGRKKGQDRWTYKFKKHSQEYTQDVFFDDGRLLKVGPLTPYPNYKKKMVEAETLEDYEIHASLYQKQKARGFREINSVKKNDIRDFCDNMFSLSKRRAECESNMTGKKFWPVALTFCQEEIWGYSAKLNCFSTVANKVFSLSALEFCAKSKSFLNSNIQKLQCLRNSSSHPLFSSQKRHPTKAHGNITDDSK